MDFNGFSQKIIIRSIVDDDVNKEIIKFMNLLKRIDKGFEIFLHNKIRTILFKKKEDADEQKNLRTISIIPAWLMVLEKLAKPIIQKLINQKLNKNQFGFRPKSDCGIAKAMIFFNAKKYQFNKSLLIDIKKAYDTVNLDKLINIVNENFNNEVERTIINSFIKIYKKLVLIIKNTEINPNRGLPQGSALSPILFSLYINNILMKLNEDTEIHTQAYADDIIIQGKDIKKIQDHYNKAKEMFREIDLEINPEKCELISDNGNDRIIDKDENENETIIQSKKQAKYLGQIINENGIPTNNIKSINFGNIIELLSKCGELTKVAKIRIFQTYMRSKINHLIPLIILTGGTEDLWKTIRKFSFHKIIECSTLPRESASAF